MSALRLSVSASGFRASGFRVWGLGPQGLGLQGFQGSGFGAYLEAWGDFLVSRLATGVLAVPSTEIMGKSTESRGWAKVVDIGDYSFRIFKTPKP